MAGISIGVTINDEAVRRGLDRLPRDWRRQAAAPIGMALVRGTQRRFESATAPDGSPWKPLNPAYAAGKRGPGILRESRMLFRSITYRASSEAVRVGTNRVYGAIHQLGGTITAKSAGALRFPMGGGWVTRKSVTIPARPYLGVSREDEQAIGDVLEALFDR